ncbi:MAG: phytoene/squalene synthase family protein [Pseudomonadota bacterium]
MVELTACRRLLRAGSRTFFLASLVLPRGVRGDATGLYAFCRLADDVVDLDTEKHAALAQLRERLARVYQGRPLPIPADRAFAAVVARCDIPRALPEALLEGFQWDAEGRRYDDFAGVCAYSARVAGTVGAMMAMIMGVRERHVAARACDLGVAMQLTNIARDVGEDARAGRLYLPLAWLREAGIDADAWLARPQFSAALGAVVQRLLHAADVLYRRAGAGVAQLPPACRPGMNAARVLYAEIGRELERRGLDSISQRAVVPFSRKLQLLPGALAGAGAAEADLAAPALAETVFLVEAVAAAPLARALPGRALRRTVEDRVGWLVDLFARLEERERAAARAAAGRRAAPAAR